MTPECSDALSFSIILMTALVVVAVLGWAAIAGFVLGACTIVLIALFCSSADDYE